MCITMVDQVDQIDIDAAPQGAKRGEVRNPDVRVQTDAKW